MAIALLVIAVLLGLRSGALPQLGGLAGAGLGIVVGLTALPAALPLLTDVAPTARALGALLALLLLVGMGEAIGSTLGQAASRGLGGGLLGAFERVAGGAVGAAQAVLILWLAGGVLAAGPLPRLAQLAQTSVAVRAIDAVLHSPTELVIELGRVLDDSGLPDVFIGLDRLPAPAVDLPTDPIARAIAARANASLAKIVADACSIRSSGSGFVVAPGYLVTNAHVISGARRITVQTFSGSFDATLVFIDPELDVAVLRVPKLDAPALRFATHDPTRGAQGATIGFPGGGDEVVLPAAVSDAYAATGLDITGAHRVTRRILELRAAIDPGDSGGPFLLADGTVAGVVFAESKADPAVGYALSPTAVATRIEPALSATAPVAAGPCLH